MVREPARAARAPPPRSGSLCYAAVSHCAADLSRTDDPIPEKCGDQDQQRRESSTRDQGHGSDEHRRSLAAARRGRHQRLVDDLELDAADLEKRRRELRPLDSGLEIADAHDCVVQREAKLPLPMLVDVTQRSAVALVELIERLLSFEGPPLLELELALIEGAQGGGRRKPRLLEPLGANGEGRL